MPSPRGGGPHVLTGVRYSTQFSMEESPAPGHSLGLVPQSFCPYSSDNFFQIGAFILFNLIFYTAVIASGSASNEGQFSLTRLLPQQLTVNTSFYLYDVLLNLKAQHYFQNVFFEKRGFQSLLEDFPDTEKILKLVQSIESEEWLSKTDTMGDEL